MVSVFLLLSWLTFYYYLIYYPIEFSLVLSQMILPLIISLFLHNNNTCIGTELHLNINFVFYLFLLDRAKSCCLQGPVYVYHFLSDMFTTISCYALLTWPQSRCALLLLVCTETTFILFFVSRWSGMYLHSLLHWWFLGFRLGFRALMSHGQVVSQSPENCKKHDSFSTLWPRKLKITENMHLDKIYQKGCLKWLFYAIIFLLVDLRRS